MPQTYFADSWFFIANIDRSDAHHSRARRLAELALTGSIMTHDAVLTEVLAFFSAEGPSLRAAAAATVRTAMRDFSVISPDRSLFLRALDWYERRSDKKYSHVDCMSMVVMHERGLTHVLTNDHHFEQEGFNIVSA
jgi:predicted nucleic acid-binding protein